jgi:hypothetical protein
MADRSESEERRPDVFQPDVLLPMQYFGALKRKKYPSGEHRLIVALMRDAVDCFQKYIHSVDAKRRQLYLDAEAWIGDEDDHRQFSFNNVCELLGMNSTYIREGLFTWRDEQHQTAFAAARKRRTERASAAAVGVVAETEAQTFEAEVEAEDALPEEFREQLRAMR